MVSLLSLAHAQDVAPAANAAAASPFASFLPLILVFVIFYFLLIRPQQKKYKEHQAMINAIRRGDRIITGGGIIGSVTKVDSDGVLQVEIAQGVTVKVAQNTVASVINRGGPAEGKDEKSL